MIWIARDKDNTLKKFKDKPIRKQAYWVETMRSSILDKIPVEIIDSKLYPTLSWNDEPIKTD